MHTNAIPVRIIGPGSQPPEEAELQYLEMPRGMNTFAMPRVPEHPDAAAMDESRALLGGFLDALNGWDPASRSPGPRLSLERVSPAALQITNQMLGEGEVSVRVGGEGRDLRIQESVFAGIWRVTEVSSDGSIAADWIEAGPVPGVVAEAAAAVPLPAFTGLELPAGAMNSPALLGEIDAQCRRWRAGQPAHVINLTLLPMTPEDQEALRLALQGGPVAMLSRGFGNCHLYSTGVRNVWRVQYFNNANTLILDSIEVIDLPEEAVAAPEDLLDSRERLAELVEWMAESAAD